MQGDIFLGFEPESKWKVVEIGVKKIWNEQNKMFEEFVTYCHTFPVDFPGPEKSDKLPWEE